MLIKCDFRAEGMYVIPKKQSKALRGTKRSQRAVNISEAILRADVAALLARYSAE